ncbi:MAG: hypothetical protein LAT50_19665, partial [Ectothiorhodospiraceae bacterium]|nr:hypothetical protein [Ectothiorhodospiraceae bacterium]
MNKAYRLNWLRAGDARQVARLEAKVYPRSYRSGVRALREQLHYAEAAGENLSVGLFLGNRLVGYCLLFAEEHRQKICAYLDISPPPGLELDGPGLYLADLAVHPAHRSRSWALVSRLACVLESRDDLRSLPMEALSTPDMLRFWKSRRRVLASLGFVLERTVEFQEDDVPFPLHWLQFAQRRTPRTGGKRRGDNAGLDDAVTVQSDRGAFRVGVVRTDQGWSGLSEDWDRLCADTPGATVFCSFPYLRAWWRQLGLNSELRLVVVQQAISGEIQTIAPMQVLLNPTSSPHRRCLSFIGQPSEVDRPTLLTRGADPLCARLIADYLMRSYGEDWDSMILYEQQPDSPFLALMQERLGDAGLLVDAPAGQDC